MENQPKYVRFSCWGNSGRSPFAAAVADNYLIQKGLDGLYRATSAGVGVYDMNSAARNATEFAMDKSNAWVIESIFKAGLARADKAILFAGKHGKAQDYLNGSITALHAGEVGQLVNMIRGTLSYEERTARAALAREFGFPTDLSEHTSKQTEPRVGIAIDFAMDKHVFQRLESMWRQADGALRPKLIAELGPYATEDPEFTFADQAYGKLEPTHDSYRRFAHKVAPIVRMAIDKAQKEGLLTRN